MKRYIFRSLMMALSLPLLTIMSVGCSSDMQEDFPARIDEILNEGEVEVEIKVYLSSRWVVDADPTRVAPPESAELTAGIDGEEETRGIDKVRIIAFRRKTPEPEAIDVPTDGSDFFFDPRNYKDWDVDVLPEGDKNDILGSGHSHKTATCRLVKSYGYEYRVIALAYDSKAVSTFIGADSMELDLKSITGDQNRFTLHDELGDALSFKNFKADITTYSLEYRSLLQNKWGYFYNSATVKDRSLLSDYALQTPQLFYGTCYTEDYRGVKSEIVPFYQKNEKGEEDAHLPLKGTLFRGMAEVEVNIMAQHYTVFNYAVTGITLMSDNVRNSVSLTGYDDFLKPGFAAEAPDEGKFTAIYHRQVPNSECFKTYSPDNVVQKLKVWILPGRMRLALRARLTDGENYNLWLRADDLSVTGEKGTGIISPDSKDGYYYIRRNHKYVINVESTTTLIDNSNYNFARL